MKLIDLLHRRMKAEGLKRKERYDRLARFGDNPSPRRVREAVEWMQTKARDAARSHRAFDTDTDAAEGARQSSVEDRRAILGSIIDHPAGDLETAKRLNRYKLSVGASRNALMEHALVTATDERRPTHGNNKEVVWRPTELGLLVMKELDA